MKIFGVQLNIAWEDKVENFARVQHLLDHQNVAPGSLIVLPEMFSTGFSMNVKTVSEGTPSETENFLAALALQKKVFVVGGLVREDPSGFGRNEAVVFDPEGKLLARYCKLHPFSFGREKLHYLGGNEITTFDWQALRVTPFICYDLRFPEVFRIATRRGAQLFVIIANWPMARTHHWMTLLQARAIENQAYIVGVNRTGNDPKLAYSGRSLIIDPRGEILADCGSEEGVVTADVDPAHLNAWRNEFPALQDIRPEFLNCV